MNRFILIISIISCLYPMTSGVCQTLIVPTGRWTAYNNGSALKPPMGWASWNAFKLNIDDKLILGIARAFVTKGLKSAGYSCVNIDDGWWYKRRTSDGLLLVHPVRFSETNPTNPNGMKPLADSIHAMGLKLGLYTDIGRNSCGQCWNQGDPNLPAGTVAEREVGAYDNVNKDIALFVTTWGIDYLKVDACGIADYGSNNNYVQNGTFREFAPLIYRGNLNSTNSIKVNELYKTLGAAITATGKQMVLSICAWGEAQVNDWGKNAGNLWRVQGDIGASWSSMLSNYDAAVSRELYAGPGTWNDPDMMQIGNGEFDYNHLNEARAHFSLWSILAAPLILGNDLRSVHQDILAIITNQEVIVVNQDTMGNQGVKVYDNGNNEILVKTMSGSGKKAVVFLNRGTTSATMTLLWRYCKFQPGTKAMVRDVWEKKDIGEFTDQYQTTVPGKSVKMFLVSGTPKLQNSIYLSDMPGRINVAMNGWGVPGADRNIKGTTISLAGTQYQEGLGVHADSRLEVKLNRNFKQFQSLVGVDDGAGAGKGDVRFYVYGDSVLLYQSQILSAGNTPETISVDVTGITILELIADKISDNSNDHADWAEARLTVAPSQVINSIQYASDAVTVRNRSGKLVVSITDNDYHTVAVYSLAGKRVFLRQSAGYSTYSFSELSTGIYIINISIAGRYYSGKISVGL